MKQGSFLLSYKKTGKQISRCRGKCKCENEEPSPNCMLTLIAACWIGRTLSYPFPCSRLIWELIEFLMFPVLLLAMAKDSTGKAAKRYSLETNSSLCSIWHTPKIAFKRVEWSEQEMAVLTGCWVSSQEPVWNWHRRALGRSPTQNTTAAILH